MAVMLRTVKCLIPITFLLTIDWFLVLTTQLPELRPHDGSSYSYGLIVGLLWNAETKKVGERFTGYDIPGKETTNFQMAHIDLSNPLDGCSSMTPPPTTTTSQTKIVRFLLLSASSSENDCSFQTKISHAKEAGYRAVILPGTKEEGGGPSFYLRSFWDPFPCNNFNEEDIQFAVNSTVRVLMICGKGWENLRQNGTEEGHYLTVTDVGWKGRYECALGALLLWILVLIGILLLLLGCAGVCLMFVGCGEGCGGGVV